MISPVRVVLLLLPALLLARPATAAAQSPGVVAFEIPEPTLIPEGIAFDPVTRSFFVSSTHLRKVVRVDARGAASDFTRSAQNGLLGTLGMTVDPERRLLWVVSSHAGAGMPMYLEDDFAPGTAALHAYHVDTGALVQKHVLADGTAHFLNDVALGDSGRVYVTDTGTGALYTTRPGDTDLELFVRIDAGAPNGIALLGDRARLIVAVPDGFVAVHTGTRDVVRVPLAAGIAVDYVDGLYVHGDALLAVEPWRTGAEVGRYVLDPGATRVVRYDVVAGGHPVTDQPTTGVIAGDSFYFIANSQLRTLRRARTEGLPPTLVDPVVLRVPLP